MDSPRKVKRENNSKIKIIPGMCCSIDPKNELREKETSITHVVAIRRIKRRPFRNSIWQVRDFDAADNAPMAEVAEWRLWPENMSIIRYPDDMPTINAIDIEILDRLIESVDSKSSFVLAVLFKGNEKDLDRLKALRAKLKYYYEMRDV